jgi:membrane-associated phospholipid phosphatase
MRVIAPLSRRVACCAVLASTLVCAAPASAQSLASAAPASVPAASPAEQPDLGWLVDSTIGDFKRLPSADSAKFLAVAATAAFIAGMADDHATDQLSRSSTLATAFEPGKTLGGARLQLAGALATYGIGRLTGSPRVASVGGDLLRAQVLSQAVTAGIKMSVRRTRPDGTQFSFPSGHTSVTFASATVLHRDLGWKIGVPAYAVATYVAASRVQEKRHFLSDVAFGAAIGIVAGRTVTVGRGDARFAVQPAVAPGGAGVSFNWIGAR